MTMTEANFSLDDVELKLTGNVSIDNQFLDMMNGLAQGADAVLYAPVTGNDTEFIGNYGELTLSGLQGFKFMVNGDLLTSDGLIEHKVKFYDLNDTGTTTKEGIYRIDVAASFKRYTLLGKHT